MRIARPLAILVASTLGACASGARAPALMQVIDTRPPPIKPDTDPHAENRAAVVAAAKKFLEGEPLLVNGYKFESDPIGLSVIRIRGTSMTVRGQMTRPAHRSRPPVRLAKRTVRSDRPGVALRSQPDYTVRSC